MTNKKSQSWSVDIILAVIVFMVAFFVFYALLESDPQAKVSDLKEEASIVIEQVADEESPLKAVDKGAIDVDELNKLKSLPYDDLKRRLRTEGDFCIYIEDENGNLVKIGGTKSVGSPDIKIKDKIGDEIQEIPCSQ